MIKLKTPTPQLSDKYREKIEGMFDYSPSESIEFNKKIPDIPKEFGLGVIVGSSGSGKSLSLNELSKKEIPNFDSTKAIIDCFGNKDAIKYLMGCGLKSVPSWVKPYNILSNGEKYRCEVAMILGDGVGIDEFTSVVDRDTAKSLSLSFSRLIKEEGLKNVIVATPHHDILDWLDCDWVFDTDKWEMLARGSLRQRPKIELSIIPCDGKEVWKMFAKHHYLTGKFNKSANSWVVFWGKKIVGFTSVISLPSGTLKNAWRGHRTVILPEFQGMGIGNKVSEAIGEMMINSGHRYFSKSAHPSFGEHRNKSSLWKPTSKNGRKRSDYQKGSEHEWTMNIKQMNNHKNRVCYSHEYVGSLE
jgi:energy-coupling factor transporter ATP-binding protein EcfA2